MTNQCNAIWRKFVLSWIRWSGTEWIPAPVLRHAIPPPPFSYWIYIHTCGLSTLSFCSRKGVSEISNFIHILRQMPQKSRHTHTHTHGDVSDYWHVLVLHLVSLSLPSHPPPPSPFPPSSRPAHSPTTNHPLGPVSLNKRTSNSVSTSEPKISPLLTSKVASQLSLAITQLCLRLSARPQ